MSAGRQPKVTLVIGSGSVKCAAAIGIQRALNRAGIGIERVVGCSGGAIYAALMAMGHPPEVSQQLSTALWTRELTTKRNYRTLLRMLAPRWLGFRADNFGLRSDRLIMERLGQVFADQRIEDAQIPLHIVATDFADGSLVELSSGPMVDAIRASVSLPFAFAPWRMGERLLVDGFLADPLPVSVAIKRGAHVIVAAGFESPLHTEISSPARFAFQLSAIMANNLLRSRYAFQTLAHHSEVVAIMPEFTQRIRLFDTAKIPYIIDEGERAAEAQIPYLQKLLSQTQAVEAP